MKCGSLTHITLNENVSPVIQDNTVNSGKAKACTLPDLLCGKVWFKDPVNDIRRYARACIFYGQLHIFAWFQVKRPVCLSGRYLFMIKDYLKNPALFLHRISCVGAE